jgi:hypothetical protein
MSRYTHHVRTNKWEYGELGAVTRYFTNYQDALHWARRSRAHSAKIYDSETEELLLALTEYELLQLQIAEDSYA